MRELFPNSSDRFGIHSPRLFSLSELLRKVKARLAVPTKLVFQSTSWFWACDSNPTCPDSAFDCAETGDRSYQNTYNPTFLQKKTSQEL